MLTSLRIFFFLIFAPVVICTLVLTFGFANRPALPVPHKLSSNEVTQVKAIFHHLRSSNGKSKTLKLSQQHLNNMVNYFLNRYFESATQIMLAAGELHIRVSLKLPENSLADYLNLRFKLAYDNRQFTLHSLQVGHIGIANEFAGWLLRLFIDYSPIKEIYAGLEETLEKVEIKTKQLTVSYRLKNEEKATASLTADQKTLQLYQKEIAHIIDRHDPAWLLSLAQLLQPLFKLAYERSTEETAINENKIVIIAVSSYVNKSEIRRYLPFETGVEPKHQYETFMYRRMDMAKHFMTSALLTSVGSGSLAILLGQEKELRDAKQGSGFSFIDLAGDRAGIRFGRMATESPQKARHLQKMMSEIKDYRAFMPEVRDLPENIGDQAFKEKYGSIYSPAYQAILKKIDTRIAALPIYQM